MPTEFLIRGSDNQIKLTLTEDAVAINGAWQGLDIHIGGVTIHRTADGDGVTLDTATGLLTITPGDLTDAEQVELDGLEADTYHRGQIVLTSTLNDDGAVFGGADSEPLYFHVSSKP